MADMYVKLSTARSYTYNVARAIDNGFFASKVSFSVLHYLHHGGSVFFAFLNNADLAVSRVTQNFID